MNTTEKQQQARIAQEKVKASIVEIGLLELALNSVCLSRKARLEAILQEAQEAFRRNFNELVDSL